MGCRKNSPGNPCCNDDCRECVPAEPEAVPESVTCATVDPEAFWGGTECCHNLDVYVPEWEDPEDGWTYGEHLLYEITNAFSYTVECLQTATRIFPAAGCEHEFFVSGTREISWQEVWKKRYKYRYRVAPGDYVLTAQKIQTCNEAIDYERWLFSLSMDYEVQYLEQEYHHSYISSDVYDGSASLTLDELPYRGTNPYFAPRYCFLNDWPEDDWELATQETKTVCWLASYSDWPSTIDFDEDKTQSTVQEQGGILISVLANILTDGDGQCPCNAGDTYFEIAVGDLPVDYEIVLGTITGTFEGGLCEDYDSTYCAWKSSLADEGDPFTESVQYNNGVDCPPSETTQNDQNPQSGATDPADDNLVWGTTYNVIDCSGTRTQNIYGGGRVLVFPECQVIFGSPMMGFESQSTPFQHVPRFPLANSVSKSTSSYSRKSRGQALWSELHTQQNPTEVWFLCWLKRIPKFGCSCQSDFLKILESNPIRYDDYFRWTVEVHNAVNRKLSKPEMSVEDAAAIWRQR